MAFAHGFNFVVDTELFMETLYVFNLYTRGIFKEFLVVYNGIIHIRISQEYQITITRTLPTIHPKCSNKILDNCTWNKETANK